MKTLFEQNRGKSIPKCLREIHSVSEYLTNSIQRGDRSHRILALTLPRTKRVLCCKGSLLRARVRGEGRKLFFSHAILGVFAVPGTSP